MTKRHYTMGSNGVKWGQIPLYAGKKTKNIYVYKNITRQSTGGE
jgi:hypothetical protein